MQASHRPHAALPDRAAAGIGCGQPLAEEPRIDRRGLPASPHGGEWMRARRGLSVPALLLALLASPGESQAATFCVNSATELLAALNTAAGNGENDTIRVKRGIYLGTSGPVAFNYTSNENFSLTLEGGWFGLTSGTCSIRIDDPEGTVIDAGGPRSVMQLAAGINSGTSFSVRNLTIRGGRGTASGTGFGGLQVIGFPLLGNITIERVVFRDNYTEGIGGGLRAFTQGVLRVVNSLFDDNRCDAYFCAADVFAAAPTASAGQPRLLFLGNTVVRTGCNGPNCNLGQVNIQAGFDFPTQYVVGNSVFAQNAGVDFSVAGGNGSGTVRNSRWDTLAGTPQTQIGNLPPGTPPGFVDPAGGDFRLRSDSLLVDAGFAFADLPAIDLDGTPRQVGSAVDIGAYEYAPDAGLIFRNDFEAP
jgi:hypothetical protein